MFLLLLFSTAVFTINLPKFMTPPPPMQPCSTALDTHSHICCVHLNNGRVKQHPHSFIPFTSHLRYRLSSSAVSRSKQQLFQGELSGHLRFCIAFFFIYFLLILTLTAVYTCILFHICSLPSLCLHWSK